MLADFIQSAGKNVTVTTNKVASTSNMGIIEKYIKNIDNINANDIMC